MKNKLILLLLLLATTTISSIDITKVDLSGRHVVNVYENIPVWDFPTDALFEFALVSASWASKYTVYNFEQLHCEDGIIEFVAYNNSSTFFLRFNRENGTCEVEFNADDQTFDYGKFKQVIDFYFLY